MINNTSNNKFGFNNFSVTPWEFTICTNTITVNSTGETLKIKPSYHKIISYLVNQCVGFSDANDILEKSRKTMAKEMGVEAYSVTECLAFLSKIGFFTVKDSYSVGKRGKQITMHCWDEVKKDLTFNSKSLNEDEFARLSFVTDKEKGLTSGVVRTEAEFKNRRKVEKQIAQKERDIQKLKANMWEEPKPLTLCGDDEGFMYVNGKRYIEFPETDPTPPTDPKPTKKTETKPVVPEQPKLVIPQEPVKKESVTVSQQPQSYNYESVFMDTTDNDEYFNECGVWDGGDSNYDDSTPNDLYVGCPLWGDEQDLSKAVNVVNADNEGDIDGDATGNVEFKLACDQQLVNSDVIKPVIKPTNSGNKLSGVDFGSYAPHRAKFTSGTITNKRLFDTMAEIWCEAGYTLTPKMLSNQQQIECNNI